MCQVADVRAYVPISAADPRRDPRRLKSKESICAHVRSSVAHIPSVRSLLASSLCASASSVPRVKPRSLPMTEIFPQSPPPFQSLTRHPSQNPYVAVLSQNQHGLTS